MNMQQKQFLKFIKLLSDNDLLKHVIVVGSWAEFVYKESGLLKDFNPNIKTLDLDFLIKNLRKPNPSKNLMGLAEDEGYIVEQDYMTEITKIFDKKGLEIEFLLGKRGAGHELAFKTNIGVVAQTLWYMNILLNNTLTVKCFDMEIDVPKPEAYVIHKIVINNQRGNKKEKDRQAIINLISYIDKMEFTRIFFQLTKRESRSVINFLYKNDISSFDVFEPNQKTLDAMKETEEIIKHPERYKSYENFNEALKEINND